MVASCSVDSDALVRVFNELKIIFKNNPLTHTVKISIQDDKLLFYYTESLIYKSSINSSSTIGTADAFFVYEDIAKLLDCKDMMSVVISPMSDIEFKTPRFSVKLPCVEVEQNEYLVDNKTNTTTMDSKTFMSTLIKLKGLRQLSKFSNKQIPFKFYEDRIQFSSSMIVMEHTHNQNCNLKLTWSQIDLVLELLKRGSNVNISTVAEEELLIELADVYIVIQGTLPSNDLMSISRDGQIVTNINVEDYLTTVETLYKVEPSADITITIHGTTASLSIEKGNLNYREVLNINTQAEELNTFTIRLDVLYNILKSLKNKPTVTIYETKEMTRMFKTDDTLFWVGVL